MIDYLKIEIPQECIDEIKQKYDFALKIVPATGEVVSHETAQEENLKITIKNGTYGFINGSLHKYNQEFNSGLFTRYQISDALDKLCCKISSDILNWKIKSVELGLNLKPLYPVESVINSLISYRENLFTNISDRSQKLIGKRANLSEYDVKVYNKSVQTDSQVSHPLRYEIKIKKMRQLRLGKSLLVGDLKTSEILNHFGYLLKWYWQFVHLSDETLLSSYRDERRSFLEKWQNPIYITKLRTDDFGRYKTERKKYLRLVRNVRNCDLSIYSQVLKSIDERVLET